MVDYSHPCSICFIISVTSFKILELSCHSQFVAGFSVTLWVADEELGKASWRRLARHYLEPEVSDLLWKFSK